MPYLTPDAPPTSYVTATVEIPDNAAWLAAFFGALTELSKANNWELFGTLTPDETADIWNDIIEAVVLT